jgi:hypothetical protein
MKASELQILYEAEGQKQNDPQKSNNNNNPSNKKVVKENNILARARLFAQKK